MWPKCFSASWTTAKSYVYPAVLYGQRADLGIVYPRIPSIIAWSNRTMLGAFIGTVGAVFPMFMKSLGVARARSENVERGMTGEMLGDSRARVNAIVLATLEDRFVRSLRSDSRSCVARGFSYLIRTDFEMLMLLRGKCCLEGCSKSVLLWQEVRWPQPAAIHRSGHSLAWCSNHLSQVALPYPGRALE